MLVGDMSYRSTLLLFCMAAAGWSATITVMDPFNVAGSVDVIGNPLQFDAQSIQVTAGSGTLTLDIRTNFDNSHLYSFVDSGVRLDVGDVFLTVNGNYAYGIPLAYHNGPAGGPWGDRLLAGHIYGIADPSAALMTARQVLHDPQGVAYRPDAVVWMMDNGGVTDVTVGTPSVQVLPIAGDNGINGPLYDIRVQTSLPAGLFSTPGDSYGIQWSVATCGNDLVAGALNFPASPGHSLSGSVAPEPGTAYLLIGAGLIGAGLYSRRR